MDVTLKCSECGSVLDGSFAARGYPPSYEIDPCEECMKNAREEAREEAAAAGLD